VTDNTRARLRPAHLLLIMLCLLLFLPTLTTLLLDRLGLALTARATALASLGALTLVLVVAAIGMLRGRLRVEWSAWALAELLTLLGVALGAAWHLLALLPKASLGHGLVRAHEVDLRSDLLR